MKKWNKKPVPRELVKELTDRYGIGALTASILIRRGITEGKDILYYLEKDKRFLHNPFEFVYMEDAVDRILQAQEEGEIVLIFGDRDVDGISSTTILYEQLKSMGIDTRWRLPGGNDGYGLSMEAVDSFYKENGTLIITVDCGISNNAEIARAGELGIDVIVLDHHNPPDTLPSPAIIVDPKCHDSGYPFPDISGAAIAYKVSMALRFAGTEMYKQEICFLAARKTEMGIEIDCIKARNLVKQSEITESIEEKTLSAARARLFDFLKDQQILVWNADETARLLSNAFGNSVEFNFLDMQKEISREIPQIAKMSLEQLKKASKISKYSKEPESDAGVFFSIFVTYTSMMMDKRHPQDKAQEEKDLQLVALAALADIMPLRDENRILVKQGIKQMSEGRTRPGLTELLSSLKLLGTRITSTKLSWNVVPALNATGRLGQPELGMELFLENDPKRRFELAEKIIDLNNQRKQLGAQAWEIGLKEAEESIRHYGGKLCVVIDGRINRGVSGILAGRLVGAYNVPAMAVTFVNGTAIGSMRSCRGFSIPPFLDKMADIFINHGGHDQAAGFSFDESRLDEFKERLEELYPQITLSDDSSESIDIDAELPPQYLTPDILDVVDMFEPYGEANPELVFLSQGLKIQDALIMGRPEPVHLKLTLDAGRAKWPAVFFGEAQRLHRDFDKGDMLNVLYQIQRNTYNGNETPQMVLEETQLCQ